METLLAVRRVDTGTVGTGYCAPRARQVEESWLFLNTMRQLLVVGVVGRLVTYHHLQCIASSWSPLTNVSTRSLDWLHRNAVCWITTLP